VLEHGLRLAREVAPPTPKGRRGRPWRYDHGLYLALLLFRAFFHLTYRKTEALLQDLMEAPFPSHRSLARYAVQHLDPKLLEALLERLSRELEAHLSSRDSPEEDPAPLDATGLAYRREDRFLRFRRGAEVRRVRAREGWDPEVYRFRGVVEGVFGGMKTGLGGAYLWGSLGRPWCGRFWSSSPTALGSFSPFFRRPPGTRRFTRQAHVMPPGCKNPLDPVQALLCYTL
jgi:hypothetical protein